MVASRLFVAGFAATASASYLATDDMFTTLLKRQDPGTPAYNCHDNCGTAITVSKAGGDVCSDEVFKYDYDNCLACAGPSNYDIWKYYGGSLSSVASGCGLSTTPSSEKKEDVPEAKHPGSGSASSVASEAPPASTPEPTETPATSNVESEPAVTPAVTASGTSPASTEVPEVSASASTSDSESGPESVAPTSKAVDSTTGVIPTATISGVPYPSSNGTATFSSSLPQQTVNAADSLQVSNAAAMIGAIAMGAMVGFGN